VVERAPSYPLLLYACLATAARHLSHTTNLVPPNTADEYHEKCIAILLPGLGNWESKIGLEILLASTVILRFFEQLSCTSSKSKCYIRKLTVIAHAPSNDSQRHLLAGSVYISSQVDCAVSGGLAEAAFWVFVMQDIQFGLTSQKPLRLTLSPFGERLQLLWSHRTNQTDRDWAHQAVWLLAETINHCYGVHDPNMRSANGRLLKQKIEMWETRKPDGFRPLHFSLADSRIGRPYPVIWYTKSLYGKPFHFENSWLPLTQRLVSATAMQHICMAKVLIQEQELRDPHAGHDPSHTQDTDRMEVRHHRPAEYLAIKTSNNNGVTNFRNPRTT
jgi:hypothetical protein